MLLTVQDLAIIAFIITVIVIALIWRVLNSNNSKEVKNTASNTKKDARVIQFLESQGYHYLKHLNELHLDIEVDDSLSHVVAARNIALLKKGDRKYLLKIKTDTMSGKKYTSPPIRTPLLEMQGSYKVDGIILFDKQKDKMQVISFPRLRRNIKFNYILFASIILNIVLLLLLIKQIVG